MAFALLAIIVAILGIVVICAMNERESKVRAKISVWLATCSTILILLSPSLGWPLGVWPVALIGIAIIMQLSLLLKRSENYPITYRRPIAELHRP